MRAPGRGRPYHAVYAAASLSLAYVLGFWLLRPAPPFARQEALEASRLMARATAALRECRAGRGVPIDPCADPNGTGLIGEEHTAITTSSGRLEAKRTTANPAFAGLVVSLLREAGVRRGDAVAVGASSSFPALIVATLSAAKIMGLEPLVISSLGSSEWGANVPAFSWLDMEDCLREKGLIDVRPIARAIGGEGDVGQDMSPEGRQLLSGRIGAAGAPFLLDEPDLGRNVARRMDLYRRSAGARPIRAFVNIGGSWANMGTDAGVLTVEPGLARRVMVPPPGRRGVIQAMAAEGVPVLHLLNVRGLCERYGLPWDPRPLPSPEEGPVYRPAAAMSSTPSVIFTIAYLVAVTAVLVFFRRSRWPGR